MIRHALLLTAGLAASAAAQILLHLRHIALGSVTIPIAPAPPALALPLLGLLALRRRADSARQHADRPR